MEKRKEKINRIGGSVMFFKQFQRRFTSQADVLLSTIYSINTFDENTVKYVLNCDVNTTIGFEKIIYKEGCNNYLSTPVGNNFEIVQEQIDSNYVLELISGMNLYEVSLQKGSIFPLKNDKGIFQNIQNVLQEREKIWIQFLTQKEDKAKEDLIEQYIDYLSGIANPSDALFKRKFQKYVYQLFESMNYPLNKNSQVKDIEAKIKEPLYQYQLIIGIYAEDTSRKDYLQHVIANSLEKVTYFNRLQMSPIEGNEDVIDGIKRRKIHVNQNKQYISVSEILSLVVQQERQEIKRDVIGTNECTVINPISNSDTNTVFSSNFMEKVVELLPYTKEESNARLEADENTLKILNVMREQNIIKESCEIIKIEEGSTIMHVTLSIPSNVKFRDIKKHVEDIRVAVGLEDLQLSSASELNSIMFSFPKEKRSVVYLRDILSSSEFLTFSKEAKLPFIIGLDGHGKPLYEDLTDTLHMLIAGATGSGKTYFLIGVILSLCLLKTPYDLHFYIIDPKRIDFKKFKDFPHVQKIVTEVEESTAVLAAVTEEMDRRYALMEEYDIDDLVDYNVLPDVEKLPYIVCIVDEFSDLVMQNPDVKDYIVRIGQKARAAGIYVICGTQRPEVKVVDGLIKANLPTKIAFSCGSYHDYKTVFGGAPGVKLLGKGDALLKSPVMSEEYVRFQSPVVDLSKGKTKDILQIICDLFPYERPNNGLNIKPLPTPYERIKSYIIETGDTAVTRVKQEMKLDVNVVRNIMDQLVDEGLLIKTGKGRFKLLDEVDEKSTKIH